MTHILMWQLQTTKLHVLTYCKYIYHDAINTEKSLLIDIDHHM